MRISPPTFSAAQNEFVRDFLSRPGKRYLYGRTLEAASISKLIPIDGFIDDFTTDTMHLGLPCIKLDLVPDDARVISTVVQAFANAAMNKLRERRLNFIDYFAFKALSKLPLREIPYWEGAQAHFETNKPKYLQLYEQLADQQSKDVLERVINFRLNQDIGEMDIFTANLKGMYFEPFLNIPKYGAIFFDVGAFDGYNSMHFFQMYPEMSKAILFEPVPEQAIAVREKIRDLANFEIFDLAVSDEDGELMFSVNSTASRVSNDGSGITVKTCRLDTFCESRDFRPDMIKMDIEGSEIKALLGAQMTIQKCKPNLAISVYHNVSHLTEAFEIISRLNPDYKYYIRHYTEGYTETVLFAVNSR